MSQSPPPVEVRRSTRRTRTVSAYRRDGKVVVMIPARFTRAQEQEYVAEMVARLERSERGRQLGHDDLMERSLALSRTYLDGVAVPASVRWVSNMKRRWASCTSVDRTIRVSDRLHDLPRWVVDYVLLHELAHLIEPNHSKRFWALVDRYPQAERAKGYLDGFSAAGDLGIQADGEGDLDQLD